MKGELKTLLLIISALQGFQESLAWPCRGADLVPLNDEALAIREQFFTAIGKEKMDLVIILERTQPIDLDCFYFEIKNLVNHTLRYYAKISPSAVRLAILTFAKDVTVHVDGLSKDLYKCELWEGQDKFWEKVLFNTTGDTWHKGNLGLAYMKASELFKNSQNTKRYIWLITSGHIKDGDPKMNKDQLLKENVTIYGVVTGHYTEVPSARNFLSSDEHLMGTPQSVADFLDSKNSTVTPITVRDQVLVDYNMPNRKGCYCDIITGYTICGLQTCNKTRCTENRRCVYRLLDKDEHILCGNAPLFQCDPSTCSQCDADHAPCRCSWSHGMSNPSCTQQEKQCVPDACFNNGVCVEDNGYYTCNCTGNFKGRFCRTDTMKEPSTVTIIRSTPSAAATGENKGLLSSWKEWKTILIAIGVVIGLIMFLVLVIMCYYFSKRRRTGNREERNEVELSTRKETSDAAVYTNPQILNSIYPQVQRLKPFDVSSRIKRIAHVVPFVKPPPPPPKPINQFSKLYQTQAELLNHRGGDMDVTIEADGKDDYENAAIIEGMNDWERTVREMLTTDNPLTDLAITHKRRKRYISSGLRFLPTQSEIDTCLSLLQTKVMDVNVNIKQSKFSITQNDGFILESYEQGNNHGILCIGKSRRYLVFGYMKNNHMLAHCRSEVTSLVQHLINVGL